MAPKATGTDAVLLEAARAAVLAAHAAAGLCAASQRQVPARLLRSAVAVARAAVASLQGEGLNPAHQGPNSAQRAGAGASLAEPTTKKKRKKKKKQKQGTLGLEGTGATLEVAAGEVNSPSGPAAAGSALPRLDAPNPEAPAMLASAQLGQLGMAGEMSDVDAHMEGSEGFRLQPRLEGAPKFAGDQKAAESGGLEEVRRLCAAHGPEAQALLARIVGLTEGSASSTSGREQDSEGQAMVAKSKDKKKGKDKFKGNI